MEKHVLRKTEIRAELLTFYRRDIPRRIIGFLLTALLWGLIYGVVRYTAPDHSPLSNIAAYLFTVLPCAILVLIALVSLAKSIVCAHHLRKGQMDIRTDTLLQRRYRRRKTIYKSTYFFRCGKYVHIESAYSTFSNMPISWGKEGDSFYLVMAGRHIVRAYPTELFKIVD